MKTAASRLPGVARAMSGSQTRTRKKFSRKLRFEDPQPVAIRCEVCRVITDVMHSPCASNPFPSQDGREPARKGLGESDWLSCIVRDRRVAFRVLKNRNRSRGTLGRRCDRGEEEGGEEESCEEGGQEEDGQEEGDQEEGRQEGRQEGSGPGPAGDLNLLGLRARPAASSSRTRLPR